MQAFSSTTTWIGRMGGGVIFGSTDAHQLPTVVVIFARPTDPSFDAVQTDLIRRLLAHLSRSLGVMLHLRDSRLRAEAMAGVGSIHSGRANGLGWGRRWPVPWLRRFCNEIGLLGLQIKRKQLYKK